MSRTEYRRKRRKDWTKTALKLIGSTLGGMKLAPFEPQLAKLADKPPEGEAWLHEIKWDGYRLVVTIMDGEVRIWSRNGNEWTGKVPEIRAALEQLGPKSVALDGELIAGEGKQVDFNLLQATLAGEQRGVLTLVLFDILYLQGVDVTGSPLLERKELLASVLENPPARLAYSSHVVGRGATAYEAAAGQKFEGIISKRADAAYHAGRSDDWRKIKRLEAEEYAVVGTTPGKGARKGIGALLLARPDREHGWSYAGRVGSGFTDKQLRELEAHIGSSGQKTPTVHLAGKKEASLKDATWFEPMFVVEVLVRGVSTQGFLRQPSLKGIRLDKDPADLLDGDQADPAALAPT